MATGAAHTKAGAKNHVVRDFPDTPEAPALARHFAVRAASRLGAAHIADDVALVVTELAANALLHARSATTVALRVSGGMLHIAVRDNAPLPAKGLPVDPTHGLGVVSALAARWGVRPRGAHSKTIWADLPLTRTTRTRRSR